jgi:hypothetical protein
MTPTKHWIGLLLTAALPAWGAEIPQTAVVRFNTVCTNCHEGECSGRMSFTSGAQAAQNHVRRYLGNDVETREIDTFFALLQHTKEKCAPYPLKANIPASGRWEGDALAGWRNPVEGGYYIPLGTLQPGAYRLRLTFSGEPQGRARITDAQFDIAAEESLCRNTPPLLTFTASGGAHYFHLQGKGNLQRVELER